MGCIILVPISDIGQPFLYNFIICDLKDIPLPMPFIYPLVGIITPSFVRLIISLFIVLGLVHNSKAKSSCVSNAPCLDASLLRHTKRCLLNKATPLDLRSFLSFFWYKCKKICILLHLGRGLAIGSFIDMAL